MTSSVDEIQTTMDPVITNISPVETTLVLQVGFVLVVDVVHYGEPAEI